MKRVFALVALAAVLALIAPVHAVQSRPPTAPAVVERLLGRWEGRGTILGRPARVEAEWMAVLDRRFVRLTWSSAPDADPVSGRFEGHAYYPVDDSGRLSATWYDSTGQVRPIEASVQPDALVARWGTPETEVGETTYRVDGADRLEVVDRVRGRNGEWREFGRSTLTRRPARP